MMSNLTMGNLTTFYLIRHGQTDWNKERKLQGHMDIPLNETGEQQAREIAKKFKNVDFDLAFSSDLIRAKRTAEIIVLEKNLAIQVTKLLRERNFHHLEAGPVDALLAYFKLMKELDRVNRMNHRIEENIESDQEVITRLITFIRETAITHPSKTVLLSSHSGLLRMLLLHTGYFTYEQLDKITLANGAYIKFRTDGVDFFIDEVTGVQERKHYPENV